MSVKGVSHSSMPNDDLELNVLAASFTKTGGLNKDDLNNINGQFEDFKRAFKEIGIELQEKGVTTSFKKRILKKIDSTTTNQLENLITEAINRLEQIQKEKINWKNIRQINFAFQKLNGRMK